MGPHTLAYRAAVRVVVLAAAEKAANDPTFRPELADRLAELRPDVEEWQIARRPPRGLATLWADLCGAPGQVAWARKYLKGTHTCTRDSALAPPGWDVEQRKGGGRPRKIAAVEAES